MAPKRKLAFQSVMDERRLLEFFDEHDIKRVHAMKIWKHVIVHSGKGGINDVPGLPDKVYDILPTVFGTRFMTSTLVAENESQDKTTTKLLIELQDGLRVESVIMKYDSTKRPQELNGADEKDAAAGASTKGPSKRATVCVSSQVGCAMGCTFCATGTMGIIGDLTAGEILEQLLWANAVTNIRNVVFMGMGEPLNNYREVAGAVRAMIDNRRFALGGSHVTISTVGVVPKIAQLGSDLPSVSFALSLHAPTQEDRERIVPSASAHPIPRLLQALDQHHANSGRGCFIEYVMLCGVNDQPSHAHQLGELLHSRRERVSVNLIPWNPMLAKDGAEPFDAPNPDNIREFHRIVFHEYQIPVTIRQTMGQDIDGACGQLALKKGVRAPADIEDIAGKSDKKIHIENRVTTKELETSPDTGYNVGESHESYKDNSAFWVKVEYYSAALAALAGSVIVLSVGLRYFRRPN